MPSFTRPSEPIVGKIHIGLTDHIEGPRDRPTAAILGEVAELVMLADRLGARFAWFTEHHDHVHEGHLPTPLLLALHLAGQTHKIQLGTAIICLNLHHPLDIAEQTAVADLLMRGRLAPGFGSGSTPGEFRLFGLAETADQERHARFAEALAIIHDAWRGQIGDSATDSSPEFFQVPAHRPLPVASADLWSRTWIAVNSVGSARIAGTLGLNMLFSHLRTPAQYRQYAETYRSAGGNGLIAANRPVFVGPDDATAWAQAEPALRRLWRRFQAEGKIPADMPESDQLPDLAGHPINFIIGGPESVARQLRELWSFVPFDVANVEVRWAGLDHDQVCDSMRRLMEQVMPLVNTHGQPALTLARNSTA